MKYHISSDGNPKICKAEERPCPLGSDSPHFDSPEAGRAYFESIMEALPARSDAEQAVIDKWRSHNMDTLIAVNDSEIELIVGGKELNSIDEASSLSVSEGNSKDIAEILAQVTEGEDDYEDGLVELQTISHKPLGDNIGEHHANVFTRDGQEYVFDAAYSEVDPNARYPYLDTVENWRKEINRVSFVGRDDYIPPPPDPRTFELQKFAPGEHNPLIEKAKLGPVETRTNGALVQFLEVDQVKVAAVSYRLNENGAPKLNSVVTRDGYKNQGYMKKLLSDLAANHGVEQVESSGSYTPHGYNFTRHLTAHAPGDEMQVNFPNYTDEEPFTFVDDWVEGRTFS